MQMVDIAALHALLHLGVGGFFLFQ